MITGRFLIKYLKHVVRKHPPDSIMTDSLVRLHLERLERLWIFQEMQCNDDEKDFDNK